MIYDCSRSLPVSFKLISVDISTIPVEIIHKSYFCISHLNWRRKCDSCGGAANVAVKKSINNLIIIAPTVERGIFGFIHDVIRVEEIKPRTLLNFYKTI